MARLAVEPRILGPLRDCNLLFDEVLELWLDGHLSKEKFLPVLSKRGFKQMDYVVSLIGDMI